MGPWAFVQPRFAKQLGYQVCKLVIDMLSISWTLVYNSARTLLLFLWFTRLSDRYMYMYMYRSNFYIGRSTVLLSSSKSIIQARERISNISYFHFVFHVHNVHVLFR